MEDKMNDQKNLLVGLDFSDDYTQISCYHPKHMEAESIGVGKTDQFLIPTALCMKNDTRDWLFGVEAITTAKKKEGILVDHLVELAKSQGSATLFEINFMASTLLEKFFRKVLGIVKMKYPNSSILQLVVTVEDMSEPLTECIYTAMQALGINKDRVVVKSHAVVAMYYTLNQNKDLWMNDVGIFHYTGTKLFFYHISINRRTKPCAVTVKKEELTDAFKELYTSEETSTKEYKSELSELFHRLAKTTLSKHVISTLFITGKGFEEDWIDETLQKLCLGRRIFKGQNLYTKGACYMARELKGEKRLEDYILLSEDMLHSNIFMTVYVNAKIQEVILAKIGTPWYEVKEKVEIIFDGKAEVVLHCKSLFARETETYKLALDDLPDRPNKMTRASLSIQCKEKNYVEASLRDLGFGTMYPATDAICTSRIPLV